MPPNVTFNEVYIRLYKIIYQLCVGQDSSVVIATRYGLGGQEIESRRLGGGVEMFRTRPDRPSGPPNLLYNGNRVFPGGEAAGVWRCPLTHHLAPRLKKRQSYTSTPLLGFRGLF